MHEHIIPRWMSDHDKVVSMETLQPWVLHEIGIYVIVAEKLSTLILLYSEIKNVYFLCWQIKQPVLLHLALNIQTM